MSSHRKPPLPHKKDIPGKCNVCGETVYRGGEKTGEIVGKGTWHHDCMHSYFMETDPQYAKRALIKERGEICVNCGIGKTSTLRKMLNQRLEKKLSEKILTHEQYKHYWELIGAKYPWEWFSLELDHIVPLINGGGFGPDNLQLLCHQCHKDKTSREATERAHRRRQAPGQTSLFNEGGA